MYKDLVKLSKNLFKLDFKKQAQEILILEGVDPEEIASALGLAPMPEEACPHSNLEIEESNDDLQELMEKLFGEPEKDDDKDEKKDDD